MSRDTIRHYERLGLIDPPARTDGGYRLFPLIAADRITLIRDAVRVGFSLRQLGTFLRARRSGRAPCRDVRLAAARILDSVNAQIDTLASTRDALQKMLDDWDARLARTPASQQAHLLDALDASAAAPTRSPSSNLKRRR